MKLGDFIKEYRKENSLSMDKFAELSGLSKGYISMLEKNKNPNTGKPIVPSVDTIQSISKVTGITFDTLLASLDDDQKVSLNKDDFKKPNTIAAHLPDGVKLTEKEEKEVRNFVSFILSQREEGNNKDN